MGLDVGYGVQMNVLRALSSVGTSASGFLYKFHIRESEQSPDRKLAEWLTSPLEPALVECDCWLQCVPIGYER